jgi:hypothetical protein
MHSACVQVYAAEHFFLGEEMEMSPHVSEVDLFKLRLRLVHEALPAVVLPKIDSFGAKIVF